MFIRIMAGISAALWLAATLAHAEPATAAEAAGQYRSGHVLDAEATLKAAIPLARNAGDRWALASLLTDICAYSFDYDCIAGNQKNLADAAAALNAPALTAPRIVFAIAFQQYLEGNLDFFRKTAGLDFALKLANPLADPALATRLFLLNAAVAQKTGDFAAAHRMIDRAFASFLRIDSNRDAFETAALLKELISLALANHDTLRALHWALIGDPIIRAGLSPASFDYADYLTLTAQIAESLSVTGDPALAALQQAMTATLALQIAPGLKDGLVSNLAINQAALYGLRGDPDRMRERLAASPFAARRDTIIARGAFSGFDEMFYAAAEIFFDGLSRKAPDPRWKPLFEKQSDWVLSPDLESQRRIYTKVALALLSGAGEAGGPMVREAARETLAMAARGRGDLQAFPLPTLLDRITLTLAIGSLPPKPKGADADLLLGGLELIGRNARYAVSDMVAMLAAQDTEEERHAAHALLRLSDRRRDWEAGRLKALAARVTQRTAFPAGDFTPQIAAQGFADSLARMEKWIKPPQQQLPSASELQAALAPDEAFLAVVQGLRVCVRRDSLSMARVAADPRQILLDVKLLSAALSAQNAPSDKLDSQYPAPAAMRLYHLLFDGLEGCLNGAQRLIYVPAGDVAGIPLAALLSEEPPKVAGGGYDLARAHWLVLDYAVSTVTSARDFLSSRKLAGMLAKRAGTTLNLAAVGDPRLDGPAAGALKDLAPLPETRAEVTAIAGLFKSGTDVKLGAAATEENFRSLPLDRYQILHFATHGLLRDDIDGLSEAALVFTPEDAGNGFDDGLLTASDVANLNLAARLVVLSACNTANFDPTIFASQLQGLASAFAAAGAPTMVASLWSVNSESGMRLMTRFYAALLSGAPDAASALQRAMIETLRDAPSPAFRNPRFWAPFLLLGDGGVKIAARTAPARRDSQVEVSPGGGEIMAMVQNGAATVSSEIGPVRNGRASSLVRARSAGAIAWSLEDKDIAAGRLVARGGVNYAAGYLWQGRSVPVLRAVSRDGKLLWRKEIASRFDSAVIASLAVDDAGGLFALVMPLNEAAEKIDFDMVRLDASGREQGRRAFTLSNPGARVGRTEFATAPAGDDLYVTVARAPAAMQPSRNDFGFASLCYRGGGTHVFHLRAADLATVAEGELADIQVRALLAEKEGLVFAGAERDGCARNAERALLGRLDEALAAQILWRDAGVFYGHLISVASAPGGYVAVAGIAEPLDAAAPVSGASDPSAKYPVGPGSRLDEAVLIRFDGKGQLLGKTFLGNGLPQFAQGLIRTGPDAYAVFGSDGFNPWLERIN